MLCALHAVGCDGRGGDQSGSTVYDDAGNCVKDREALSEILVQPQACVSSAECPPGSFCNGETGQCDWECYTDSDCGFGATCSCDGICQDGSPPGPGATGDPACPRDLDLLQDTDPDIHNRECTRDEHCPYGARCDEQIHRCDFDCLAEADCTGGTVCSCRGECVEPGCEEPLPEQRPPTVEVTPDVITVLPGNTWGKQTFSIRITHPDANIGAGLTPRARIEAPTPTALGNLGLPQSTAIAESINTYAGIHFSTTEQSNALAHANTATATTLTSGGVPAAIAARMVAARPFAGLAAVLDVDGAGASTLQALKTATAVAGTACTVQVRELLSSRWVVDTTSGYTATTSVSVSRCSAVDSYPRDLNVSVYFVDAVDQVTVKKHLAFRTVRIDTAGAVSITPTTATGEFSGYLVQENAVGHPLTIPVRAFAESASSLKVFDDVRLLSATGWFELSTAGPTFLNHIDQATGNGGVSPGQTPGTLGGELGDWTDELLTGGRRDGYFTLTLATSPDQPLAFRYRLVRQGSGTAPSTPPNPTSTGNTLANLSDAWRVAAGAASLVYMVGVSTPILRRKMVEQFLCYDFQDVIGLARPFAFNETVETYRQFLKLLLSPASGDLQCTNYAIAPTQGMGQTAMGLVSGWDSWVLYGSGLDPQTPVTNPPVESAAWVAECLQDLARGVPSIPAGSSPSEETAAWFGGPAACVNLAQVFTALGYLVHDQVDGTGTRYLDRADGTLLQRVLAQWLDVHAFVLQQGVQEHDAQAHLASLIAGPGVSEIRLDDLLARAERAWNVVLDQDYLNALSRLPRADLARPDYRIPRPTSYWTFDPGDISGTHLVDVAGEHHLNVAYSPQSSDWGIYLPTAASAEFPHNVLSPYGDVTLSLWFKPESLTSNTYNSIFRYEPGFWVRVYRTTDSGWQIRVRHQDATYWTTTPVQYGSGWTHVVVVRKDRQYRVYRNGTRFYTTPMWADTVTNPSNAVAVTHVLSDTDYNYPIRIDDLALWETALSDSMVQEVFGRGQSSAGNPRPLLAPIGSLWSPSSAYYVGNDPNSEQGLGLPVKIAETAAMHAGAIEAYSAEKLTEAYGGCYLAGTSTAQVLALQRAGASMGYVTAAEALAREIRTRAGEVTCTGNLECAQAGGTTCGAAGTCLASAGNLDVPPAWDGRFQEAMSELAAMRSRAVAAMQRLQACENPFGVPDDDLPIYFGDVEGTNSRYFASSDYLAASWARPAVQSAVYSLEAARDGWLAKRDSDIRQLMNEYEAERRLEGIELGSIEPVIDACGITEMDALDVVEAFNAGNLDLTSCFLSPTCTPGDTSAPCLRGSLGQAFLGVKAAGAQLIVERFASRSREQEWDQWRKVCSLNGTVLGTTSEFTVDYANAVAEVKGEGEALMNRALAGLDQLLDVAPGGSLEEDWAAALLEGCTVNQTSGAGYALSCAVDFAGDSGSLAEAVRNLVSAAAAVDGQFALLHIPPSERECWASIQVSQRHWMSGMDAIALRQSDLQQAWHQFSHQVSAAGRQVVETTAALSREAGRTLPSVAHHYWLDEKIGRFQRDFARAKRFTYLAMRAVEYEFQQSLGLRTQILTASHPDDLVETLDILDAERATRSINSRRPAPGTEVLSLRTDILALGDLHPTVSGERASTAALRLQDILTSPDYAYYDENGEYLGQAVPFTVSESGALRHRCGERLWRVTATIQGDLTEVDEPRAQVFLLKRNVFKSQWCDGLGDGTSYQQASTAGGNNLFTADATTVGRQVSENTPALIYPWYNVRRSDFYRDDYTQGSSEELAGRGLYGEYVLLFPHYGMLEPAPDCVEGNVCSAGTSPGCSDPFRDLRRIEDVLLRFDYLSVDDL